MMCVMRAGRTGARGWVMCRADISSLKMQQDEEERQSVSKKRWHYSTTVNSQAGQLLLVSITNERNRSFLKLPISMGQNATKQFSRAGTDIVEGSRHAALPGGAGGGVVAEGAAAALRGAEGHGRGHFVAVADPLQGVEEARDLLDALVGLCECRVQGGG
jgi:hypothetical protein